MGVTLLTRSLSKWIHCLKGSLRLLFSIGSGVLGVDQLLTVNIVKLFCLLAGNMSHQRKLNSLVCLSIC